MLLEAMEKTKKVCMRRDALGFFKAVLESYEEVALMSVLDGSKGEAEIIYPSSAEETLKAIIEDMAHYDILIQEVGDAQ